MPDNAPPPRGLLAGPGAWRALVRRRAGRVELVTAGGAYLALGEDRVLLASSGTAFGPLSLVVEGLDRVALAPGLPVAVGTGWLSVGGQVVSLERLRVRAAIAPPRQAGDVDAAIDALLDRVPPPSGVLRPGLRALAAGELSAAVECLAGLGRGLTPEGDDVLCGYAAWPHPGREPVCLSALAAGLASPIGLAYLRCAERGELPDPAAPVLGAMLAGDRAAALALLPALLGWGDSSGAALLRGLVAAARRGVSFTPVDGRSPSWMEDDAGQPSGA